MKRPEGTRNNGVATRGIGLGVARPLHARGVMSPRSASIALALGAALLGVPVLTASCGKAPPTPRAKLAPPPIAAMDGEIMTSNQTPIQETLDQQLKAT